MDITPENIDQVLEEGGNAVIPSPPGTLIDKKMDRKTKKGKAKYAALMKIEGTPQAKDMTHEQKLLAADAIAILHPEVELNPVSDMRIVQKIEKEPVVRDLVISALKDCGVDEKFIARSMKKGMNAMKKTYVNVAGVITDERTDPDWAARSRYMYQLAAILGLNKADLRNAVQSKFVYKSKLRGGADSIEVTVPLDSKSRGVMNGFKRGLGANGSYGKTE